jgi:hypothetical protein
MSLLQPGTRLLLEDQAEGWFPLAPADGLHGSVLYAVETDPRDNPFYVISLDPPLEVQERNADTPSGLRSAIYEYAIVKSRWLGSDVGAERQVSTFILLPQPDTPLPTSKSSCIALPIRAWALCSTLS